MENGAKPPVENGQSNPSGLIPNYHFKIFDMSKEGDVEEYLSIVNTPNFRPFPFPGGNLLLKETNWVGEKMFLSLEFVSFVPDKKSKQKKSQ